HGNRVTFRLLEEEPRAAGLEHAVADLGDLETRGDLGPHSFQRAAAFELREKIAKVGVFHGARFRWWVSWTRHRSLAWPARIGGSGAIGYARTACFVRLGATPKRFRYSRAKVVELPNA